MKRFFRGSASAMLICGGLTLMMASYNGPGAEYMLGQAAHADTETTAPADETTVADDSATTVETPTSADAPTTVAATEATDAPTAPTTEAPAVESSKVAKVTPAVLPTLIHADLNEGDNAIDIGDTYFNRDAGGPTGEKLYVDVNPTGGPVTNLQLCLRATAWTNADNLATCANRYTKASTGAGSEFTIDVPAGLVGQPIYALLYANNGGVPAYAMWHQTNGPIFGNVLVPAIGYSGPLDICPATPYGRVLNHHFFSGGTEVPTLHDLPINGLKVKFTIAPGCSDETVSLALYRTDSPDKDPNAIDKQTFMKGDTGTFSQKADAKKYKVESLNLFINQCFYQVDFVHGTPLIPNGRYGFNLIHAGHGGEDPCVHSTSSSTSSSSSSSSSSSTSVTVLGSTITRGADPSTTAAPQVLGTTLATTGVESTDMAMFGFGFLTTGIGITSAMRRRMRKRK